jgi:glutamate racemase
VACNTATTNSISFLRANLNVPFIGVEPAIKPAATNTKTGSIGVLATKGTLSSGLFNMTSNDYCSEINIIETVGEGLVDLIENGIFKGKKLEVLLYKFLKPMLNANIDHLVLGCTHYPLIIESIKKIIPNNIKILDSGAAVAKQTKNILSQRSLLNNKKESNSEFYCNSTNTTLKKILGTKYQIETI